MKKIISVILMLTLILSFSATVFASETETVGGKITLTQFLGATPDNTKTITLSRNSQSVTVDKSSFYSIADSIILTSQLDVKVTDRGGLFITAEKTDGTFEYAYVTENGEADKYSLFMSRLPYAMYIADDKAMLGSLFSLLPAMSDWAVDDIAEAQNEGLIPDSLNITNYMQNINREQFCDLAFAMLHKKIGLQWYTTADMPFQDTNNMSIGTLYKHGIINGKSETEFAPNDLITREEAATILYRMMGYMQIGASETGGIAYADEADLSDWAKDAVHKISASGIMKGTGNDRFSPKDNYTIEQAVVTMIRLIEKPSAYAASLVLKQYFDAYAKADYETMKKYSTAQHIELCFHDGDVWGNKWAKLISMEPVHRAADSGECVFNVSIEMETVPTSSQYPADKGGMYVIMKFEDGDWKVDAFATGL